MIDQQRRVVDRRERIAVLAQREVEIGALGFDLVLQQRIARLDAESLAQHRIVGAGGGKIAEVDRAHGVLLARQDVEAHARLGGGRLPVLAAAEAAHHQGIVVTVDSQHPLEQRLILPRLRREACGAVVVVVFLDRRELLEPIDEILLFGEGHRPVREDQHELVRNPHLLAVAELRLRGFRLGELDVGVGRQGRELRQLKLVGPRHGDGRIVGQRGVGLRLGGLGLLRVPGRNALLRPGFGILDRGVRDQVLELGQGRAVLRSHRLHEDRGHGQRGNQSAHAVNQRDVSRSCTATARRACRPCRRHPRQELRRGGKRQRRR